MKCICEHCGQEFNVNYKSQKRRFCSKTCAISHRWQSVARKKIIYVCEVCGKEFSVNLCDHRIKEGKKIKYCSKKCAGEGSKTGKIVKCENCGKEFYTTRNRFCSVECAREHRRKNYIHKTFMENGYICEYKRGYSKNGTAKQHRLIIENHLGRRLSTDEVVHHKNGNKTDNRLENLEVMKNNEHISYHRKKEKAEGKHLFGGHHNN